MNVTDEATAFAKVSGEPSARCLDPCPCRAFSGFGYEINLIGYISRLAYANPPPPRLAVCGYPLVLNFSNQGRTRDLEAEALFPLGAQ